MQSRDADVHNVREGLSPSQLREQLGAHASPREDGDRGYAEAREETGRLSDGKSQAQGQKPVTQVLEGDKGMWDRRREGRSALGEAGNRSSGRSVRQVSIYWERVVNVEE